MSANTGQREPRLRKGLAALLVILTCLLGARAGAAPFDREFDFTQPDSTVLRLHGWGDEFHAVFETREGYTVVFDRQQKAYCYAQRQPDGTLGSTGQPAHRPYAGRGQIAPHLRAEPQAVRAQAQAKRQEWEKATGQPERWRAQKALRQAAALDPGAAQAEAGTAHPQAVAGPTIGSKRGLTLLIDFSDQPATIPQSDIDAFCNSDSYTGYGNNGSVKRYFLDNSSGALTYSNYVTAYVRVPSPRSYYNDTSLNAGIAGNYLLADALQALKARPDYAVQILPQLAQLTTDGSGEILACNVFFAGSDSGVWSYGLWPHSWTLAIVGPIDLGNGLRVNHYQISDLGQGPQLRTFCHENGHMLCGYPDLYDYDYDSYGGAGCFCLMAYARPDNNPAQLCAYLKLASGWAKPIDITVTNEYTTNFTAGDGVNQMYRLKKPGVPTEYYLIENRQPVGRDAGLSGGGLAV